MWSASPRRFSGRPARPDQIQIIISEQVVALQRRDVGGNPEERFAHRCWHKTS